MNQQLKNRITSLKSDCFHRLTHWFIKHQRALPWRRNRTPYRVWISEIMLQQTRSETVREYYIRWMKRFPTLKSLASYQDRGEREKEILSLWQGLGYYHRALNILTTAEKIMGEYRGRFPRSRKEILSLPGIGPYTAGAILNFGFTSPTPTAMVDGNFTRVFSRLFHLSPQQTKNQKTIWEIAETLLEHPDNTRPQLWNEGIMEIGAIVCQRNQPLCPRCPLNTDCRSYQEGKSDHSPFTVSRKIIPAHSSAVVIQERKGILLMKGKHSPLSSLWRFPTVDRHPDSAPSSISELFHQQLGIEVSEPRYWFSLRHHYTKYRITLKVWKAGLVKKPPDQEERQWRWVSPVELAEIGLSSSDQKIRRSIISNTCNRAPDRPGLC